MNRYVGARSLLRSVLLGAGFAVLALLWTGFGWRIIFHLENHIGFDPNLALIPLSAVLMVALGLLLRDFTDRLCWAMLFLTTISILGVLLLRLFNVLLPYELWLRLGMPDRPF